MNCLTIEGRLKIIQTPNKSGKSNLGTLRILRNNYDPETLLSVQVIVNITLKL